MPRFRLEELLRIAIIAITAVLVGAAAALISTLIDPQRGTDIGEGTFPLLVLTFLGICLVGIPAAIVAGFLLHLILRLRSLPRVPLLPLFLLVSFFTACFLTARWHGLLPMTLTAGAVAWALYCFGPFRLWRFEFSPS